MKSLVISPLVRHISCLVMVDVLDQLKMFNNSQQKEEVWELCWQSPSQWSVRPPRQDQEESDPSRSYPGRSGETLQSAGNTDTDNTDCPPPPSSSTLHSGDSDSFLMKNWTNYRRDDETRPRPRTLDIARWSSNYLRHGITIISASSQSPLSQSNTGPSGSN